MGNLRDVRKRHSKGVCVYKPLGQKIGRYHSSFSCVRLGLPCSRGILYGNIVEARVTDAYESPKGRDPKTAWQKPTAQQLLRNSNSQASKI